MRLDRWRVLAPTAVVAFLVGGFIAYADADADRAERAPSASAPNAESEAPPPPRFVAPSEIDGLALVKRARVEDEKLVSTLETGQHAELTVDPDFQAHVRQVFQRYAVPAGAFVAVEPASGRLLAYVSHNLSKPGTDMVVDTTPPAASIFKIVTSAALIEAGVKSDARTCYGGGLSRIAPIDLKDDPRRDTSCISLAKALGSSTNAVFAKRATRHLDRSELSKYAKAFGFGQRLPSEVRATAGRAEIPDQELEFARTAAGFWHTFLSPLHGAIIAATVANGGVMPSVRLIDRVVGSDGKVLMQRPAGSQPGRRVLSAGTARELGTMMQRTVRDGTSHDQFYDSRGRPYLQGVDVAGKTGSLSASEPYRAYSWWVGFAPADKPVVALSALVVNSEKWRIKSSFVARDALEYWLPRARCAQSNGRAAEGSEDRRCTKSRRK